MKNDDSRAADEIAERYLASINRLTDRKPIEAMTQGIIRSAIRAAVSEGVSIGRTSMHADLMADHRV